MRFNQRLIMIPKVLRCHQEIVKHVVDLFGQNGSKVERCRRSERLLVKPSMFTPFQTVWLQARVEIPAHSERRPTKLVCGSP